MPSWPSCRHATSRQLYSGIMPSLASSQAGLPRHRAWCRAMAEQGVAKDSASCSVGQNHITSLAVTLPPS